ncbi:MAG: type VI secretion system-associated protein TagO [Rhodospirillaceae bacterium]
MVGLAGLASAAETDLSVCHGQQDDGDRLECYDQRSGYEQPEPVTEVSTILRDSDLGSWHVTIDQNPMDDTDTVIGILNTNDIGLLASRTPTLVLRCQSWETEAYINWKQYLGNRPVTVTYRIGKAKAIDAQWSLSTNNKATFVPDPVEFIKSLVDVETLVARVTPYNESPVTAEFKLKGIIPVVTKLANTCWWDFPQGEVYTDQQIDAVGVTLFSRAQRSSGSVVDDIEYGKKIRDAKNKLGLSGLTLEEIRAKAAEGDESAETYRYCIEENIRYNDQWLCLARVVP